MLPVGTIVIAATAWGGARRRWRRPRKRLQPATAHKSAEPFAGSADTPEGRVRMSGLATSAACGGVLVSVERAIMGARIIKTAISLAAIATSAISVFAVSWVGLALLGH